MQKNSSYEKLGLRSSHWTLIVQKNQRIATDFYVFLLFQLMDIHNAD